MTTREPPTRAASSAVLRPALNRDDLVACFPVIAELRPALKNAVEWCDRVRAMQGAGYRVLAAWDNDQALALAGYRVMENLIHGRFLYVDDLVSASGSRGMGLGARLLQELSAIARKEGCGRLVLDTAARNEGARRFYRREGLNDVVVGFVKTLEIGA